MLKKILGNIEEIILFCTMSALIVAVTIQIAFRLVGTPPSWTEEVSRQLLTWTVFVGAAAGVKLEEHVGTTFLVDSLPLRGRLAARLVADLLFLIFAVLLAYHGAQWVSTLMASGQRSTNFQVPVYLIAAAVPVAFTLSAIHLTRILFRDISRLTRGVSDDEPRSPDVEMEGV